MRNFFPIVIKDSYFPTLSVERELFLKSKGKVFFEHCYLFNLPSLPFNSSLRQQLHDDLNISSNDEFGNLLTKMLSFDVPKSYLEGFKLIDNATKVFRQKPKAILSAESWYFNESFKQWAAKYGEKGTALIGIQHGGNYGIISYLPYENHELAITKRFYSWGWKKKDNTLKVMPLPAPRLMCREVMEADNKQNGILLVTNCSPRYFYGFYSLGNYDIANYFNWQQQFVNALCNQTKGQLRVRLFIEDYGCDCIHMWRDLNPQVKLENWDTSFLQSLEDCRLNVCDHLGNTYLEALVANKPTVLFWNPKIFEIRQEAKAYFDELHSAGILYYDPVAAAQVVNSIYGDIERWWNQPERQAVRKQFCDQFAISSPDSINIWAKEFIKLAR